MFYTSTRDSSVRIFSAEAILRGISAEGGLFVPESVPKLSLAELKDLCQKDYIGRAKAVLSGYLSDFTPEEIACCIEGAYGTGKFSDPSVAPVVPLGGGLSMLELWKGPTCAFKDMALQLLPRLMTTALKKMGSNQETVILVATSGDTGKAALEGFRDVPGVRILVFYPNKGVSPMQRLQMVTQEGANVGVCAVEGNFDDAQTGVKAIFTDPRIAETLAERGMCFSSANSINWGRLAPQIVYYVSAYCDLVNRRALSLGEGLNFVVPTGNFGNILAACYAKEMGLPIHKLICASNANRVLTEFIQTGLYDCRREFYTTISPSMDILISSNLERLLYLMSGRDTEQICTWMRELQQSGSYQVSPDLLKKIQSLFAAGCCDDAQTKQTIAKVFREKHYLCDPHTAVGLRVYEDYRAATGDGTPTVVVSTASPFKFGASVLEALQEEKGKRKKEREEDEFNLLEEFSALTGAPCPPQLTGLRGKPIRFAEICTRDTMEQAVFRLLGTG